MYAQAANLTVEALTWHHQAPSARARVHYPGDDPTIHGSRRGWMAQQGPLWGVTPDLIKATQ